MKKILLVAALLTAMTARAQMSPEAIMGSAPGMPSWESVADYFKGLTYYLPSELSSLIATPLLTVISRLSRPQRRKPIPASCRSR